MPESMITEHPGPGILSTQWYELRVISQDSFDTTRSIWTFVTNQRRILDDNAPENSRSEAQLLVVKIPPWLFAVLVQKGHHKVKNSEFFL